ncbi:hypothetical protein GE09DRAFT_1146941 [Coniochaeta sp. 2T2.1]|nr:hypothetical protein GE09DRAFT_1146941 [Coniochaeta sp. 2T2.1]
MTMEKDKPMAVLTEGLGSLFIEGKYSDLTVACGPSSYRTHKAVLCTQSPFFAKACDGSFKEASTGIIELTEDDPEAVRMMMHYFYHHDYPHVTLHQADEAGKKDPKPNSNLVIHSRVYALGEKYAVEGLMAVALAKFVSEAKVHWESKDFLQAVEYIYSATPEHDRGLRDAVKDVFYKNRWDLMHNEDAMRCLREVPDLAYDVFIHTCKVSHSELNHWGSDAY